MLKGKLAGEITTKGGFNKYMGYTAKDLPKEDTKVTGFIYELEGQSNHEDHEGYLVWIPAEVFEASHVENSEEILAVAGNPQIFIKLSPLKQRKVLQLIKDSL